MYIWSSLGSLGRTDSQNFGPWATESQIPNDRPVSGLPMNESKFLLFFQLAMGYWCTTRSLV